MHRTGLVLLAALAGRCGTPTPDARDVTPVLVGHRFVDPDTGAVVGELPPEGKGHFAYPVEGRPGRFQHGQTIVDVASRRVVAAEDPDVRIGDKTIERVGEGGEIRWSIPIEDPHIPRAWRDVAIAGNRAFVGVGGSLVALDHETGKQIWRVPGNSGELLVSGSRILAVEYGSGDLRSVVARDGATGKEAFRTVLPRGTDRPGLVQAGDLVLAGRAPFSWLLDAQGTPRVKLDEEVQGILPTPPGWLIATPKRLARIDGAGATVWERPPFQTAVAGIASFTPIAGGDVLAMGLTALADMGVEVVRLSPRDGREIWRVQCGPLMVDHSEYHHFAYLEVRGERVVIVSQGSSGNFVETRWLDSGRMIHRFRIANP